jgi:hypothetical protein
MGTVATAAGRQARFAARVESRCKRTQAEDQNEKNGEAAPHLVPMLHESLFRAGSLSPVEYHQSTD